MIYLFYSLICLLATILGAISGIGGGVIIKPVLDATSSLTISQISFLSRTSVLTMSAVSLLSSRKGEAKIDGARTTPLAIGSAIGGVGGKLIFDLIKKAAGNDGIVGVAQNAVMIAITGMVLLYVLNKTRIRSYSLSSPSLSILIGICLGMVSAFLGIGGGPINLAVLYFFFSMDTKTAALNSLYMILFAQSASLLFSIISNSIPTIDYLTPAIMIAAGLLGGYLGRQINRKISSRAVDLLFRGMLISIVLISIYNLFRYSALV